MSGSLTTWERGGGVRYPLPDLAIKRAQHGLGRLRRDNRRRTWLFPAAISCCTRILDVAMVLTTGALAHFTRFGDGDISAPTIYSLLLAALASVNAFQLAGLYSLDALSGLAPPGHRLPVSWGLVALVLMMVGFVTHTLGDTSRIWVLWFVYGLVGLTLVRLCLRYWLRRLQRAGHLGRNVVIVGPGDRTRRLVEHLSKPESAAEGLHVLRLNNDTDAVVSTTEELAGCPVLGRIEDLCRFASGRRIDEVIIALPWSDEARISSLVNRLSVLPLTVRLCPDWIGSQVLHREIVKLRGVPLLTLAEQPLSDWRLLFKDFVDRALALMMLVMAAPLLLVVAAAIRLDSRGPVLYRQHRHGFNQEVIKVFKFRTMHADRCDNGADAPVKQATRNDPRVTRVGRYLRRSSLDELPQLLNVLKGDMSLVGPRPHAVAHTEYYGTVIDAYLARHKVKPGITGWAQVNGLRGETGTLDKMEQRVQHDLYYIKNWSLWLDVRIIFRTLVVCFLSPNAD